MKASRDSNPRARSWNLAGHAPGIIRYEARVDRQAARSAIALDVVDELPP